jgi:sugar-specific transcriptional regulator TrmB
MKTSMIDKDLEAVGLGEKESKVYLAALELGRGTAQQIAQKANVKRPTTYVIMEDLMKQGLASSFYEGKKQYFVAENPERLVDILKQQQEEVMQRAEHLQAILPQLHSINNRQTDKPVVKYYEGKEGIIAMVNEHAKANFGQEAYTAYSRDLVEKMLTPKELGSILQARVDNEVKVKTIYTNTQGDLNPLPNTERIRLQEIDFSITCDIAIYNDRIRIASLKDRLVGIVIEDKEIARSFKAIFALAWKYAKQQQKK